MPASAHHINSHLIVFTQFAPRFAPRGEECRPFGLACFVTRRGVSPAPLQQQQPLRSSVINMNCLRISFPLSLPPRDLLVCGVEKDASTHLCRPRTRRTPLAVQGPGGPMPPPPACPRGPRRSGPVDPAGAEGATRLHQRDDAALSNLPACHLFGCAGPGPSHHSSPASSSSPV